MAMTRSIEYKEASGTIGWSLTQEGEGNDRVAGLSGFLDETGLQIVRDRHFAGGDLGLACSDEAEIAASERIAFHTNWRPKDAAGHGPPGVDVAEARCRIERRTRRLVGEVFEAGLVFF
jgi:hypothetical protein